MRKPLLLAHILSLSALSACATPALGCGLALGELIQDESEKKLLIMIRQDPSAEQRVCVAKWARRNGLKAVFVDNIQFPGGWS